MNLFAKSIDVRRMENTSCPDCNGPVTSVMQDVFDGFGLARCQSCGLHFTNPRPVDGDIPKLYEGREAGMDIATESRLKFALKSTKVRHYMKALLKKLTLPDQFSALDIGCGDGLISYGFAKAHGCARSVGSDFDPVPPPMLSAHGIEYAPYGELFSERHLGAYDVVTMRHVLEHVPNPRAFIQSALTLLKDGGYLCIEVPDFNSHWRKLFGRHYNQLVIPYHLYHFTPQTLSKLLDQLDNVSMSGVNVPVIGPSLGKALGIRVSQIGLMAAACYPPQIVLDKLSGNYTAILAIARKRA